MGSGAGGWVVSRVINYSLYEFSSVQSKESSNRIELSRLVQDLLNFGVLGSQQLWGVGVVGWGVGGGGAPIHVHMHAHMHTHTCTEIANGCQHGGIHVYHV